jgi:chromosome segregation ATPase
MMSTPAHASLTSARSALADIESRLAALGSSHSSATREIADAEDELTKQLGAEQIGEADPAALKAARARRQKADESLRSIVAGRAVLTERLPAAKQAVAEAEREFRHEAAELITPTFERACTHFHEQARQFALAYTQLAKLATVAGRVQVGVIAGDALMKIAGQPLDAISREMHVQIQIGFGKEPARLTEQEILNRLSWTAEAAE